MWDQEFHWQSLGVHDSEFHPPLSPGFPLCVSVSSWFNTPRLIHFVFFVCFVVNPFPLY